MAHISRSKTISKFIYGTLMITQKITETLSFSFRDSVVHSARVDEIAVRAQTV
ncbi:hypothetical protein [Acinetobacter vivianii]|uniref:hypothetical protein n=1 Tax=Acinetobacter vivianii TaxID=1776742 RepID=UPI00039C98B4|nr:hypothetical protein [Acinetobacter vivianii]